ncbi:maltose alpha-D-glucosyltransferase/ alpha-amylase [Alteromonadaceae bacterium Bs31]|nr:maltose alpha-D-glucosyltransferase/ alpha-amylase [Alteromonadaceae bacterium Bs31]
MKRISLFTLLFITVFQLTAVDAKEFTSGKITGEVKVPPGPKWLHNAVFYQIYPQTFYDTNADGIGDLPGIIEKLDYVKSLGVDGIWLNPFFESPFLDAGYDVSDYYKVAPRYGTNQDAEKMFSLAEDKGLKILFDYVISYSSIEHPWFQASAEQAPNQYSNWYIWTDNTWLNPPAAFSDSFIKGYSRRNGQFMRNFYWSQPALNFGFAKPEADWMLAIDHPDVLALQDELFKMLRFWMDMGADGFRADMAGALVKTQNISGNDQFFNTRTEGTKIFWNKIRKIFDEEYKDSFMVAEWSFPEDALNGGGFHADFFHWFPAYSDVLQKESWRILNGYSEGHSFFDREGKGNIVDFLDTYMDQYSKTVGNGYVLLPLGNHDLSRLNIQRTDKELEMIFAFNITMPGIPFIYYGNEIGMRQLYGNPHVEGAYKPRAGARTPMQWSKDDNLGFSKASAEKLYLPVDAASDAPNVAEQEKNPNSLLNKVRAQIKLKKEQPALAAYAEFVPLYAKENTYPFVYARAAGDETLLVLFNPSKEKASAKFKMNIVASKLERLMGDELNLSNKKGKYSVDMPAISYAIYKLHK